MVALNINKNLFKKHLLQTLNETSICQNITIDETCKFIVVPKIEQGKRLNSTDDTLHRWMLNDENLSGREFDLETVINMLGCKIPFCPVWINVVLREVRDKVPIIELQTSLRFRKPSLLHNQDTGHPPFKAIVPTTR